MNSLQFGGGDVHGLNQLRARRLPLLLHLAPVFHLQALWLAATGAYLLLYGIGQGA